MKRASAFLLATGLIFAAPAVVHATAITDTSDFTVTWSLPYSGTGVTAAATATFSNFDFIASNKVSFEVTVANTSTGTSAGEDVRLVSFAWDTTPVTTVATDNSSIFSTATGSKTKLESDNVSVCLYGGTNCNAAATVAWRTRSTAAITAIRPIPASL